MTDGSYLGIPDATWAALHRMGVAHALDFHEDMPHFVARDADGAFVVTFADYDLFLQRGWVEATAETVEVTGWGNEMLRRWELDYQRRQRRARA